MDIDIHVRWDHQTNNYVGSVMGGNQDLAGRDDGGDSILGWWWSRENTMRVLRRLFPNIDDLNGFALSEEEMSAEYVVLESTICGELESLLGPNCPPSLYEDAVMDILDLMQLEMDKGVVFFLDEIALDTSAEEVIINMSAEEVIINELERRSRGCHEATGIGGGADGEEAKICSICLDGLYQENESFATLDCEHEYHVRCIKEWLMKGKNECPYCRGRALPLEY